jgi:hypothetical protein
MPISSFREADATWIGKALQSRRNIHPISEQISTSNHDIADVNPDPKPETLMLRSAFGHLGDSFLHGNGALDGIDGTWKLSQNTVASGVGDPSTVLRNQPIHHLAMGGQRSKGSDLILLHEARVACHVSREDGCQPPLDLALLPIHGSLGAVRIRF